MTEHEENKDVETEDTEKEEGEEITAMTGGMGAPSVASTKGYAPGGHIVAPGAVPTVISSGGITWGTTPSTGTFTPKMHTPAVEEELVDLPTKITKKVLLAFIDEKEDDDDKNVLWAANLKLIETSIDIDDDTAEITITLSLKDTYGNKK